MLVMHSIFWSSAYLCATFTCRTTEGKKESKAVTATGAHGAGRTQNSNHIAAPTPPAVSAGAAGPAAAAAPSEPLPDSPSKASLLKGLAGHPLLGKGTSRFAKAAAAAAAHSSGKPDGIKQEAKAEALDDFKKPKPVASAAGQQAAVKSAAAAEGKPGFASPFTGPTGQAAAAAVAGTQGSKQQQAEGDQGAGPTAAAAAPLGGLVNLASLASFSSINAQEYDDDYDS